MSAVSAADPSSSSTPQEDAGAVQETSREAQLDHEGQGGEDQRGTPEEHEDSSRDVEVVEGGGRGGGGGVIIEPALVYTKKGEVVEVDQNIVGAVDLFRAPDGFARKGRREQSFMYSLGVYVEEREGGNHKYFCMADTACRRAMKVVPCRKGDRSNVNTHLKSKHGLQGSGGVKKEENKRQSQEGIKACFEVSRNSGIGTNRVRELLAAKMAVEKFLPFNFFSSGTTWQELISTVVATEDTPFPALTSRRVKHLLVEMFVATKKVVVGNMEEEIEKAPLPIIHYGLDLWTCAVSGRKYLDVQVSWVDSSFVLRNALIAVKHYAPSAAAQEGVKASEILFSIFKSTLAEFGIELKHLAGGKTNSGPDVKGMCVNSLLELHKIYWDWCDCHLADKAAETREELGKALVQSLHSRLWDKDTAEPSPFRDATLLLTPSHKNLDVPEALRLTAADAAHLAPSKAPLAPTLDEEEVVESKLDGCWADIKARASEAARKEHSRAGSSGTDGQPPLKRPRTLGTTTPKPRSGSLGRSRVGGDSGDSEGLDSEERLLLLQVTGELERYQALYIAPEEVDTRNVLPWWRKTGREMFPYLAPVAQQVFGNQAAAAAKVERDFSATGSLLVPNRSRIDTYWVEMVMFLNVNFKHIPALKNIPRIAAKDIRACLPARFTGGDADRAATEAAFDVINNTANSDIGL